MQFGLRPDAYRHHIQECACLAVHFAFFSRADSGVLLTAINAQATSSVCSSKHGLYWSLADDSPSCFKVSGIVTECLLPLLVELELPTLPAVQSGHSLRRGGASAAHAIGASSAVIMAWDLWKSLASALLYIDVVVQPSSEALFFFGHLLPRFLFMEAPIVRQAQSTTAVPCLSI